MQEVNKVLSRQIEILKKANEELNSHGNWSDIRENTMTIANIFMMFPNLKEKEAASEVATNNYERGILNPNG